MSLWPSVQEYLLKYEIEDEDQLFKCVYERIYEKKEFPLCEKLELVENAELNEDQIERAYFQHKQDTYFYMIGSAVFTIPTGISLAISNYMMRNAAEIFRLQANARVLFFLGIPAFSMFNYGTYRRFFYRSENEVLLRKKYAKYLQIPAETKNKNRKNY